MGMYVMSIASPTLLNTFGFIRQVMERLKSRDGFTALEFALIAPVLLLFTSAVIEFGLLLYAMSVMESATTNTSRLGKTGFTAGGISREQTIINMFNTRSAGLLDAERLQISTLTYPSFDTIGDAEPFNDANGNGSHDVGETFDDINGNGQWDNDMGAQGAGDANDIVVYVVTYPWNVLTPMLSSLIGTDGIYNITARTVVKNEPYDIQ